tara:strand:+ start:12799 stop:13671 length:873 start_codon:yes stop_codon:yes gene_type:complete
MTKIIVLGGSGFIGKTLVDRLEKTNPINTKIMLHSTKIRTSLKKVQGSILDKTLKRQIQSGDVIVNLVGQYDGDISSFIDLNINGSFNLLESCKGKKNIKIILISSIDVYGECGEHSSKETEKLSPQYSYGLIKLFNEKIYEKFAKTNDISIIVLRLGNLYGSNKKNGLIMNLLKSIKTKKTVTINQNGRQKRDYLFIDDAVDGIMQAINFKPRKYNVFNISSGNCYSSIQIIKLIQEISNKKINFKLNSRIEDERSICADITKAKRILRFSPKVSIKQGLITTINNLDN